jgi:hypothetical protein
MKARWGRSGTIRKFPKAVHIIIANLGLTAKRVDAHRPLFDQQFARLVQHQRRLLLCALDRMALANKLARILWAVTNVSVRCKIDVCLHLKPLSQLAIVTRSPS